MIEKVKLDAIDRKILAELDKNSRMPTTILAKKVKRSREAVKYRIQQLEKKGVIQGFITSVNPTKLGYYMFKVYLKLENIPEEREKFFQELKENKEIYWMGISDGIFDCVFSILSKNITEYFGKINFLLSRWQNLIMNKIIGVTVDTRQYNKKFFTGDSDGEYVLFGGDVVENNMDEIDLKILNILANDARIPIVELARKVNTSIETVRTRIKRLEEKEIILNYRIAVDFNKLGLEFFKLILYFKNISEKDEKLLFEWMRTNPNALYGIRSLAPWEVEFEFVVENYQKFNEIVNDLREKFPNVIRNYEHLVMHREMWMPAYKEILKTSKKT
jgi:DNA-binding Lrp family transcriptional regulator